ncbi:hypothetical protein BSM4216_0163 [Bacillus smithii]|nr:hypothetical protein BSM4216_0163 [Bacillus smithii]
MLKSDPFIGYETSFKLVIKMNSSCVADSGVVNNENEHFQDRFH